MKKRERELRGIRREFAAKTVETVLPLFKKAQSKVSGSAKDYMATAQANLIDVFSEQPHDSPHPGQTGPWELQIINYIRQNKTTKEIADLLGLTTSTVESYREKVRERLRSKNKNININILII